MADTLDRRQFRDRFKGSAVVVTDLPAGRPRQIAEAVNESVGRGDATLRTPAEHTALFGALLEEPGSRAPGAAPVDPADAVLVLRSATGETAAGAAVGQYVAAAVRAREFFAEPMYVVDIAGWPRDNLKPAVPAIAPPDARLRVWRTDPHSSRHVPPAGPSGTLFTSATFSLANSGNRTANAPKRSWKINVDPGDDDDLVAGMGRLNLKAMWNDPSQMREALAWGLFADSGVPASRHTFAKLALNGVYKGLFSVIEEVDRRFLREHFGANDEGFLYKAYCGDIGCATLEHRTDAHGDSGSAYRSTDPDDGTYRIKTHEKAPEAYEDLAVLVRAINGIGLPGGDERFGTDAFRASVEERLNVRAFLRWAAVNVLAGSWDNYFATPANYYLYNSGRLGDEGGAAADPYFTFIPWDYDNSFGIDYFGTAWQRTDLIDWPSATRRYWAKQGHDGVSAIPLVRNLLAHHDFAQYYLDQVEHLLDTRFTPQAVEATMGLDGGQGLWQRISPAAYLESDTPHGAPFTERQWVNDEVYRAGFRGATVRRGDGVVLGISPYVRERCASARVRLAELRSTFPSGASGASFPAVAEPLPPRR